MTSDLHIPKGNIHSFLFPKSSCPQQYGSVRRFPVPDNKPIFHSYTTGDTLTFGHLRDDSLRFAAGLATRVSNSKPRVDLGVAGSFVGPIVMIHLPNSLIFPVILLGALATGCTVSLANPILTPTEIAWILDQIQPDIIFTQSGEGGVTAVNAAIDQLPGLPKPQIFTVDSSAYQFGSHGVSSATSWTTLLAAEPFYSVAPMSHDEQARRIAIILWSSGTTGKSKGVLLPHRALLWQCVALQAGNPYFTAEEKWIGFAPFFHTFGLTNVCLLAPWLGAFAIVMPKFDLETFLRLVSTHKITNLHIVPPIAVALAKSPLVDQPWCSLSSVTSATCGGAPLGVDIIREVRKRTGVIVKMGYGLSETGSVTSVAEDDWAEVETQLGSCGRPIPTVEVKIIDVETGKELPHSQPGEILTRSPLQMVGYINNQEATSSTLDESGFIHTGDIGILDKQNCLFIVDRLKEVIKYKGFQVSPAELDAIISGLQTVQDVGTTSIYSDEQATELPLAYVVPRSANLQKVVCSGDDVRTHPGLLELADQIRKTVEEKCVHYKWLRGGIIYCEAVPRSASGKIVRRSLKEVKGIHVPCYKSAATKAKL